MRETYIVYTCSGVYNHVNIFACASYRCSVAFEQSLLDSLSGRPGLQNSSTASACLLKAVLHLELAFCVLKQPHLVFMLTRSRHMFKLSGFEIRWLRFYTTQPQLGWKNVLTRFQSYR